MNFKPGDRIGLWGPNNYEWFISFLAIARIGAIATCINPGFKEHELEYCLNQVGTRGLLAARAFRTLEYYPILLRVFPGLDTHCSAQPIASTHVPSMRHIITMERVRPNAANMQQSTAHSHTSPSTMPPVSVPFSSIDDRPRGIVPFDDMLERGSRISTEKLEKLANYVNFDQILNVQFTSGTTGFPKAVTQSHFNVVNNAFCGVDRFISGGSDVESRICSSLPFFHSFSLTTVIASCIVNGKYFVTPNEFYDAKSVLTAIELEKCNNMFCVPTMIFDLLNSKELMRHDLSSLRGTTIGGAPCPPPLAEMWFKRTNTRGMVIGYGMTESGPVITSGFADDTPEQRYGTVGYPFPHTEVKIAGPYGQPVVLGEKGEICTRGYHVMHGYWGDEAKTKEAITPDRWLKTGDLGSMTADGYVKIEGRIKEMIKRGGENVFPAELESILLKHEAIKECYVVGVPDERLGEEICAVIKAKEECIEEGFDLQEELRDFFVSTAASFKVPKYYWVLSDEDKLPITMSGKVQKLKLKEMAAVKFGLAGKKK